MDLLDHVTVAQKAERDAEGVDMEESNVIPDTIRQEGKYIATMQYRCLSLCCFTFCCVSLLHIDKIQNHTHFIYAILNGAK